MTKDTSTIRISYLYPEAMNIYGDTGNVLILKKRLEWRGYNVEIDYVRSGEQKNYDFRKSDLLFAGGGQDRGQLLVADDLRTRAKILKDALSDNLPMLLICGSYQLFGEYFKTKEGTIIEGTGLLPMYTVATEKRMIGNVVLNTSYGEIIGFENHSGSTYLRNPELALGVVSKGYGNNGEDKLEGCILKNCIGTYLHGPLLSKNPQLADDILSRALKRKLGSDRIELKQLDDKLAVRARSQVLKRLK